MGQLAGLIKRKYPDLRGKDWINQISDEDKQVVIWNWRRASAFGHEGGIARARTAKRDERGRFAPDASSI
jgi:hypothetical protein